MDGPSDCQTGRSKSDRERQIPHSIAYVWNLNKCTSELICETATESQTQRTDVCLPRGRGVRDGCTGSLGLADAKSHIQDG